MAVPGLLGDDLTTRLARFAAEARADTATADRRQAGWLRQAADEESTIGGVLLDLAERGADVTVETTAGRRHHGRVAAAGRDFMALIAAHGAQTLIAVDAVAWLRSATPGGVPTGDRDGAVDLGMRGALCALAGDRPRVVIGFRSGADTVAGTLRRVGRDVLTIAPDRTPDSEVIIPMLAVADLTLV